MIFPWKRFWGGCLMYPEPTTLGFFFFSGFEERVTTRIERENRGEREQQESVVHYESARWFLQFRRASPRARKRGGREDCLESEVVAAALLTSIVMVTLFILSWFVYD